jgi:MerR family Zn(II)-responsive transcriptional regulator of zntA
VNGSKVRIGQLASLLGIATSAIRYYEESSLLGPGERTEAGYRLFGPEAFGRVQFIQRAKALGLSLEEIRRLVDGPHTDSERERDALRHVVAHKIAETTSRIKELETLSVELEALYTRLLRQPAPDCGHLGDCGCWLPTREEVMVMTDEIASCDGCAADCGCAEGEPCDCSDCSCAKVISTGVSE